MRFASGERRAPAADGSGSRQRGRAWLSRGPARRSGSPVGMYRPGAATLLFRPGEPGVGQPPNRKEVPATSDDQLGRRRPVRTDLVHIVVPGDAGESLIRDPLPVTAPHGESGLGGRRNPLACASFEIERPDVCRRLALRDSRGRQAAPVGRNLGGRKAVRVADEPSAFPVRSIHTGWTTGRPLPVAAT